MTQRHSTINATWQGSQQARYTWQPTGLKRRSSRKLAIHEKVRPLDFRIDQRLLGHPHLPQHNVKDPIEVAPRSQQPTSCSLASCRPRPRLRGLLARVQLLGRSRLRRAPRPHVARDHARTACSPEDHACAACSLESSSSVAAACVALLGLRLPETTPAWSARSSPAPRPQPPASCSSASYRPRPHLCGLLARVQLLDYSRLHRASRSHPSSGPHPRSRLSCAQRLPSRGPGEILNVRTRTEPRRPRGHGSQSCFPQHQRYLYIILIIKKIKSTIVKF